MDLKSVSNDLKTLDKTNGTQSKGKGAQYLYMYEDFEDCGFYIGKTGKLAISQGRKLKNIYHLIYDPDTLTKAQRNAQKGKGERREINAFNDEILENLDDLYWDLRNETYTPGEYRLKEIYDPKQRTISIAPFYPDRIVHHCIILVLGQHWTQSSVATHTPVSRGVALQAVWRLCTKLWYLIHVVHVTVLR